MYTSDNDKLFFQKLDDGARLCQVRRKPYFFSFMNEEQQAAAQKYLDSVHFEEYMFFGGCENSERRVLGLFFDSPDQNEFPVDALEFKYRPCDKLTHRDFLGALMSLGIEREAVGDILVEDGRCIVFVKSEIKDYVASQIFKIGRVGVSVSDADLSKLPQGRGVEELCFSVSSLRLDNLVAAVAGLSREKAKQLIIQGNVGHNYVTTQNISKIVSEGDVLRIRGKGKYVLKAVLGETKKHKIRIMITHFR